jgi:excisionase family DNA binding protein
MLPVEPVPATSHLLEIAHVAHRLSVGEAFVRRLIRDHKLVAIRLGGRWRVDARDLQAFIDAQRAASHNGNGKG